MSDASAQVESRSMRLHVDGMTCAGCVASVEKHLAKVPGVDSVSVNLVLETATVFTHLPELQIDTLITHLASTSYTGSATDDQSDQATASAHRKQTRLLLVGIALTAPLLLMMLAMWFGIKISLPAWLQLVLAAGVQIILGTRFYRGAFNAVTERRANMDVLVALGTTAAFVFSIYSMLRPDLGLHLYFEASAIILTLVVLGRWLESRARNATSDAIAKLIDLRPQTATVVRDGSEREIPAADVVLDDTVLIRPGQRIAVDGEVVEGISEVDESMITGESLPLRRSPGDPVIGGSLNGSGRLLVRTTHEARDSTLARIITLVENAQSGKAPIQQLVDRISAIFVPVVLAIAFVTFGAWMALGYGVESALVAAVSVLVIACPCALGLATPTALVAGMGAAARSGLLIRDIQTIERAADIDTVVFDKTGTLTYGKLQVKRIDIDGIDAEQVLKQVAALQRSSEHPLAHALVAAVFSDDAYEYRVDDFKSWPGEGVVGVIDGESIACGNEALMSRLVVDTADSKARIAALESAGGAVAYVAVNGVFRGSVEFSDTVRENSRAAVNELAAAGIAVEMLSGDADGAVADVARDLGIGQSHARVKPEQKTAHIDALRESGRVVAMVGDGVNDAPALAAADVGVAMGSGTDVALEVASVTVMRSDPLLVPAVIDMARKIRSRIRQNLFWAFAFNVVGIPLAAFGLLTPAIAGAAMAFSSVIVVSNSLRLRSWRSASSPVASGTSS